MQKKISLIVPTLGTRVRELERLVQSLNVQTYKNFEVIFVTQDNHEEITNLSTVIKFFYKHVQLDKKGLSYARNEGLKFVEGDILTFSDDDCWYPEDAFKKIITYFSESGDSLTCFQIYDPDANEYYKNYPNKPIENLKLKDILRISSIEIFINLAKVDITKVYFDEYFGLGAKYPSGEENILLADLLKEKYQINYITDIIVYHKKSKLAGVGSITPSNFSSKGPLFKKLFNFPIAIIILTFFFVKKFNKIQRPFYSYFKALREMNQYRSSGISTKS